MSQIESAVVLQRDKKRPRINTFGYFNVFVDDEPVVFSNPKEKELLACLIEHDGGAVTERELKDCLFDGRLWDHSDSVSFGKWKKGLLNTCQTYGIAHILKVENHTLSVLRKEVDCDYFSFKDDQDANVHSYTGHFMREYSWAEYTQTQLIRIQEGRFMKHMDCVFANKAVLRFFRKGAKPLFRDRFLKRK